MYANALIGDEMERAIVVDFEDKMDFASGVSRDADDNAREAGMVDVGFSCAYLGLLPPMVVEVVAIGVVGVRGVETDSLANLCLNVDRLPPFASFHDNDWIVVASSFGSPLHACHKVVQLVGVETCLVTDASTAHGLLPRGPCWGERVRAKPALMIACPATLARIIRVIQPIGQEVEETGRVAFHTPFVGGVFFT